MSAVKCVGDDFVVHVTLLQCVLSPESVSRCPALGAA
jgi:hypothetical protein